MPPPDLGVPHHLRRYASAPDELPKGTLQLTGAQAEVVADPVDKLVGTRVGSRRGTLHCSNDKRGQSLRVANPWLKTKRS
jgi:hypothetical protein